jgi:hypothetical protein
VSRYARHGAAIWDPRNKVPIPAAISCGNAHVTSGLNRYELSLDSAAGGESAVVCITSMGNRGTVGLVIKKLANDTIQFTNFLLPTLVGGSDAGPTAARAMKAGVTVVNTSPSRKLGGSVITLSADQRLTGAFKASLTATSFDDLSTQITDHMESHVHQAWNFILEKTYCCFPANTPEYTRFEPYYQSSQITDWEYDLLATSASAFEVDKILKVATTAGTGTAAETSETTALTLPRPMTTVWIVFKAPIEPQTYQLAARGTFYTRWPAAHVLGQSHPKLPTEKQEIVNAIHSAGDDLLTAGGDVAGAANAIATAKMGAKILGAIP